MCFSFFPPNKIIKQSDHLTKIAEEEEEEEEEEEDYLHEMSSLSVSVRTSCVRGGYFKLRLLKLSTRGINYIEYVSLSNSHSLFNKKSYIGLLLNSFLYV